MRPNILAPKNPIPFQILFTSFASSPFTPPAPPKSILTFSTLFSFFPLLISFFSYFTIVLSNGRHPPPVVALCLLFLNFPLLFFIFQFIPFLFILNTTTSSFSSVHCRSSSFCHLLFLPLLLKKRKVFFIFLTIK